MNRPVIGVGTLHISDKAKKYVNEALNANRLSYGPYLKKFESLFAQIHNTSYAVTTNSGTDALRIALHVCKNQYGFKDGDEVIVPAVTFIATSNIVIQNNLTPVFVDVDPLHYELDPALIEKKITSRTRAIIPVHLFGQPCDMDPILTIAKKYNLKVIEDSCETMFAHYKGRPVGSLGDMGCFSTYVAHLVVTGVGGLITTNDRELAVAVRSMVNHGRDPIYMSIDDDQTDSYKNLDNIVARRFLFSKVGYSCRLTELEGALGVAQLEDYEVMLKKRRHVAQRLTEVLSEFKDHIQLPSIREGNEHSFMMYPIVCRHETKNNLINFLEQAGIETRDMFPLITQPAYQNQFKLKEKDFPVAQWINANGFYIGCHQDITEKDIAYIKDNFRSYFLKDSQAFQKGSSAIVLSNHIPGYHNLTKIQNIPFELFDEVIFLGCPVSEEIKQYIQKNFPQIILRDIPSIADIHAAFTNEIISENIVFFDLTNMHNPSDIKRILFKLESATDTVIASRFILGGEKIDTGGITFRGLGNRFFTTLMNIAFNANFSDSMTSLRGIKRKHLKNFTIKSSNWYDYHFNISICAIKNRLSVDEFPSKEIFYEDTHPVHNKFLSAFVILVSLLRQAFRR